MADLLTNFLDDILSASMGGKRRYKITRLDGSSEEVTIEDISKYDQVGSTFGAGDINKTNQAVNEKFDSDDVVDPKLATEEGFAADAKLTGDALSELNKNKADKSTVEELSAKIVDWTYLTEISAGKSANLPSSWKELIVLQSNGESNSAEFSAHYLRDFTKSGNKTLYSGCYANTGWNFSIKVILSATKIQFSEFMQSGAAKSTAKMKIWYI